MGEDGPRARASWLTKSVFPRSRGNLWPLLLALVTGVAAGVGAYTFSYAKGLSYFGTDPKACVNCHIMEPQYAGWQKSSHHAVARCVDCHLPVAFVAKYLAKAENGYRHGKLFTTQTFEEPITVKAEGRAILQANCEYCHAGLVHDLLPSVRGRADDSTPGALTAGAPRDPALEEELRCTHCHWTVGHGERAGLGGPLRDSELRGELGAD